MYLLKLSLRPWRLAPFSQLFSALAVGFLLFLMSFLFWLQQGLKPVLARLQGEQLIVAYLDTATEKKEEQRIVDQIRLNLGAHPSNSASVAAEIKLVNTQEFIKVLKNQYPDLGHELEDLGPEMNQVVPRYVSISGLLPAGALERVKEVSGIESAESSKDRYTSVIGAFRALRWVCGVLMAGLGLALLTGLIHLSRMNAYLHRDALSLLRFWGAGGGVLSVPGMISGLIVGVIGGSVALGGWATLGKGLTLHVRALSLLLKGMPTVQPWMPIALFLLGGLLGWIAGVLGSLSASYLLTDRATDRASDRGLGLS